MMSDIPYLPNVYYMISCCFEKNLEGGFQTKFELPAKLPLFRKTLGRRSSYHV